MKDSQYFYIQGWMINRLELESKELIAYAMIYSYYRSGLETNASISYFAEIIGCSERTASNVLRGLEKKGFISKVLVHGRDGRNRNIYRINHQILVDKGVMQSDEELIRAEDKAEKPKNFTHQPEKISGDVGKNCMGTMQKLHGSPEKTACNNTNIYNSNFDNDNHSISFYSEKPENSKKNEKKEKEETKSEKISYQEILKSIGVPEASISNFNLTNEKSAKCLDSELRCAKECTIPYSFKGNRKAIETALKYMTSYSYNMEDGYNSRYHDYANMLISCMSELASDETTKIKGQIIKYYQVIDRLNDINGDERGLEDWICKFPIFWKKILREKEENGESIRYKKAFMKACIWDYMNRPYGLW